MSNTTVQSPNRGRLLAMLSVAAIFLLALAGVSFWLVRSMVNPPKQIVLLPQDTVQQSRIAAAPPVARGIVRVAPNGNSPTFRGNVIDAQTKQPIADFTIRLGYSPSPNSTPFFNSVPGKDFHGGTYVMTSQMSVPTNYTWSVRVDAPGYLPSVSGAMSGNATMNFELQPGKDIQGIVQDSTGAPVAGATIVMAVAGISVTLNPANLQNNPGAGIGTTSGTDGQFSLPPQLGNIDVAAFNDKGYAEINQDASGDRIVLRLAAWGRIQGKMVVAGKPQPDQQVRLQANLTGPRNEAYISSNAMTQTDADGNYHLDQVAPGQYRLYKLTRATQNVGGVQRNVLRMGTSLTVDVAAGQLVTVNFGGVGRPVTGKVVLPAGKSISNYNINGTASGMVASAPDALPTQMPENIRNGTQASRDMWMQIFTLTPEGKAFISAHNMARPTMQNYLMDVAADGTFRIEDVAPGDYQLMVSLGMTAAARQGGARPFQPYRTTFTVPPVPGGGYSSDAVILPDIQITGG